MADSNPNLSKGKEVVNQQAEATGQIPPALRSVDRVAELAARQKDLQEIEGIEFNVISILSQRENLNTLSKHLSKIAAKLKQQNPSINLRTISPKKLLDLCLSSKMTWNPIEQATIAKAEEGLKFAKSMSIPKEELEKLRRNAEIEYQALIGDQPSEQHRERREQLAATVESPAQIASLQTDTHQMVLGLLADKKINPAEVHQLNNPNVLRNLQNHVDSAGKKTIQRLLKYSPAGLGAVGLTYVLRNALNQYSRDKDVLNTKKNENFFKRLSRRTKESFLKQSTLTQVALVAGGALAIGGIAYGIYRLFGGGKKKKEESESGSASVGFLASITAGIGAIAGIGALIKTHKDGLKKWLEDVFGFKFSSVKEAADTAKKVQGVAEEVKNGNIKGALEKWLEIDDPKKELHEKSSKQFKEWSIDIPSESVRLVGSMSYKEFMKQQGSWAEYLKAKLNQTQAVFSGDQLLAEIYQNRPDISGGSSELHDTFLRLEELKLIDKPTDSLTTVDEVLESLIKKDLSKANEYFEGKKAEKENLEDLGIISGSLEYNRQLFGKAAKDMLEDFKWMNEKVGGAAAYDVIEHFNMKWNEPEKFKDKYPNETSGFQWGDAIDFPKQLVDQCDQHKIPIAISAGSVLVFDGAKWLALSTIAPIGASLYEYVNTGNVKRALGVYGITASPFIIVGATKGLLTGTGVLGKLREAAWGGFKGSLAPLQVVEMAYDAQYYGLRAKQYAGSKWKLVKTAAWEKMPGTAKMKANRYADRILALQEKKYLLERKLEEKLSVSAGKQKWKEALIKTKGDIATLQSKMRGLKGVPNDIIANRVTFQIDGLYGKNASETTIRNLSKKITAELLDPDKGSEFSRRFLFEKHSSKLVRFLNKIKFNETFVQALTTDSELFTQITTKKLLRNKDFMKALQAGIESGYLVEGGQLKTELIKHFATEAIERPNFFRAWISALQKKMGKNFDKIKSKAAQTRAFQEVNKKYQVLAEKARKASQIPSRLRTKMVLKMTTTEAQAKLDKLKSISKPDATTQKEIAKLERHLVRNEKALTAIKGNTRLNNAWKKYQEIITKSGGEIPASQALSPARFLRYQRILANAGRFGGVAFVVMMVHSLENAPNKVDFIGQMVAGTAGFMAGLKLAQKGIKVPGPWYIKGLAGALGLAGGVVGGHYLEGAYNYGARTVGDRFFVNRGQSSGWENFTSALEVVSGAGIGNFAELFDYYDIWNNVDLEDLIDESGNLNPLAYQEYMQASAVNLVTEKRHFYRDSDSWDREVNQVIERVEEEIKELEEEVVNLSPESEQFDEKQSRIEHLTNATHQLREHMLMRIGGTFNKKWEMLQEQVMLGEQIQLEDQKEQFIERLPAHLQIPAEELIGKMQERISTNAGFVIDPDNPEEDRLWTRLRDTASIKTQEMNEDGIVEERDYGFPEWYLRFKEHARQQYIYEQTRDYGKMKDIDLSGRPQEAKKPTPKIDKPSREGRIELVA